MHGQNPLWFRQVNNIQGNGGCSRGWFCRSKGHICKHSNGFINMHASIIYVFWYIRRESSWVDQSDLQLHSTSVIWLLFLFSFKTCSQKFWVTAIRTSSTGILPSFWRFFPRGWNPERGPSSTRCWGFGVPKLPGETDGVMECIQITCDLFILCDVSWTWILKNKNWIS